MRRRHAPFYRPVGNSMWQETSGRPLPRIARRRASCDVVTVKISIRDKALSNTSEAARCKRN